MKADVHTVIVTQSSLIYFSPYLFGMIKLYQITYDFVLRLPFSKDRDCKLISHSNRLH